MLILGVISSSIFAFPNNWENVTPVLIAPIVLEGSNLGEVWINPSPPVYIDRTTSLEILKEIIIDDVTKKLASQNTTKSYLTIDDFKRVGINLFFNPRELELELKVDSKFLKSQTVNLRSDRNSSQIHPEKFSAYLNWDISQFESKNRDDYQTIYNVLNLNMNGLVLNSGGFYNSSTDSQKYRREYSRLIYDVESARLRLIGGDINYRVQGIQEYKAGAGVSFQNEFSIQPELLNRRYNDYEIELQKPSKVEIFINKARVYTSMHPAGVLNLRELPLILGMNAVEIFITDRNGRREVINFNSSFHQNVLPKGISDYSFNYFSPSQFNEEDLLEYESDQKYFSGYYRYGLTPQMTIEANYQNFDNFKLTGLGQSYSFSEILLELRADQSCNEGCANSSFLGIQSQASTQFRNFYFQASARNFEKNFKLTNSVQSIRNKYNLNSVYIVNPISSIGLGYEKAEQFTQKDQEYLTSEYTHRFNGNISLSLRARSELIARKKNTVLLTLNWNENNGQVSGFHTYDYESNNYTNQINVNKNFSGKQVYLSANKDRFNEVESNRLFGELDTRIGALRLSHVNQNSEYQNQYNLRFSLLASNNYLGIGRYVNNSYLIIESDSESNILVQNEFQTAVNEDQSLVITDLTPYRSNTFDLDINELSFDESIEQTQINVKPTYLSGVYYKIQTEKNRAVVFKLSAKDSVITTYNQGVLRNLSTNREHKFFTGKTGKVFLEDVSPGTYQLELINSTKTKLIDIPDRSGYLDLGRINLD